MPHTFSIMFSIGIETPTTEGMATTPFIGTPPHCTNKPWTEAVKRGATTPLTAARPPPQPDHPFETHNPFTTLNSTHEDSTDNGSGQSNNILLTPADGNVVATVGVIGNIVPNLPPLGQSRLGQLQLRRTASTLLTPPLLPTGFFRSM